jgi:hypothetical protein
MKYYLLLIILLPFISCKEKTISYLNSSIPNEAEIFEIKSGYETNIKKNDSIFAVTELSVVPLETSKESLIKRIMRIRFTNKHIFIQNHFSDVLMYDRKGNFVRRIGSKGRGPGEYLSAFSFDVQNESIIISDGYRLIFYDFEGRYYKTIETYKQSKIFADEFCYFNDDNYYLWVSDPVGRVGEITENSTEKFDHFYQIKKGEVVASYIEGVTTETTRQRIMNTKEGYILSPTRFDNYVYTIKENGISKKYKIDFVNKLDINDYKIGLNDNIMKYNDDKLKLSGDCSFLRSFCTNNSNYCYFEFAKKGMVHATLWNKIKSAGISWKFDKERLMIDNQIPFRAPYYDKFNDCFVMEMTPISFIEHFESVGGGFSESDIITSKTIKILNNLNENSNPVLFFIKM